MDTIDYILSTLLFILGIVLIVCSVIIIKQQTYCKALENEYFKIKNQ